MRLWSLHPGYLDSAGLVALWREGLLAQKVLRGETRGYTHHPQLERFRIIENSIGNYLTEVQQEATRRGYRFDKSKILACANTILLPIPQGQIEYEFAHLMRKLTIRSPKNVIEQPRKIMLHPIFYEIEGGICNWEIMKTENSTNTP